MWKPMLPIHDATHYWLWIRIIGFHIYILMYRHTAYKKTTHMFSPVLYNLYQVLQKTHWQTDACHKTVHFAPLETGTHPYYLHKLLWWCYQKNLYTQINSSQGINNLTRFIGYKLNHRAITWYISVYMSWLGVTTTHITTILYTSSIV